MVQIRLGKSSFGLREAEEGRSGRARLQQPPRSDSQMAGKKRVQSHRVLICAGRSLILVLKGGNAVCAPGEMKGELI